MTPCQCCTVDKSFIFFRPLKVTKVDLGNSCKVHSSVFWGKRRDHVYEYACKVLHSPREPCLLRGKEGIFHVRKKKTKTLKYKK